MMAAQFLQGEIRPFFWKVGTEYYNSRIAPLIMDTPSADSDDSAGEALNVLWVPATLGEKTFNHILTLPPWKCGYTRDYLCMFGFGLHREEKWSALRKEMVRYTFCHEWYNCCCLRVPNRIFGIRDWASSKAGIREFKVRRERNAGLLLWMRHRNRLLGEWDSGNTWTNRESECPLTRIYEEINLLSPRKALSE